MKPFKTLTIEGSITTDRPEVTNDLVMINQAIKNCERIGIEAECVAKDEFGNKYKVIHTYYMGKAEIEALLNQGEYYQDVLIEKKNLLHLGYEDHPMVVNKFRVIVTRWEKEKIERALIELDRIKYELLHKKDALMRHDNINSRECVFVQFNSGRRIPVYIPFDN